MSFTLVIFIGAFISKAQDKVARQDTAVQVVVQDAEISTTNVEQANGTKNLVNHKVQDVSSVKFINVVRGMFGLIVFCDNCWNDTWIEEI